MGSLSTDCRERERVPRSRLRTVRTTHVSAELRQIMDRRIPQLSLAVLLLSTTLGEVWTDGLQAYRQMDFDHRTVVHKERYVSPEGVHINQAECLFSLVQPWLRKFRGLSKQGLEQTAHTFGIVRSLTLAGESVQSIADCLVIGAFRNST